MREKQITGWLIIDWKTGKHRSRQSKPEYSELGKNELLAKLTINIRIPEVEEASLAVEIDVPQPMIRQAVLEALDEEDLPGWTDAVADVVREYEASAEFDIDADDPHLGQLADAITTQALMRIESRPDPKAVREYTYDFISEMRGGS